MLIVVACFVGGWAAGRLLPLPPSVPRWLERWVITVAVPALVLVKLPAVGIGSGIAVPVVLAWTSIAVAAAAVTAVSRHWSLDRPTTGALLLVTPLGNTSFLGLAAVTALLGGDRLGPALAFDQLGSFLALATYGSIVASTYGTGRPGWRPALARLVRFPPFVALLVSIPLRWVELPHVVTTGLSGVGRSVAPVAMVAIGLRFRLRLEARSLRPVFACLGVKMVLLPAVGLAVALLAGTRSDHAWQASILELGMPPMVTAGVVAAQAGLDEDLATTVVGLGTLVAFATLPALAWLL